MTCFNLTRFRINFPVCYKRRKKFLKVSKVDNLPVERHNFLAGTIPAKFHRGSIYIYMMKVYPAIFDIYTYIYIYIMYI